MYYKKPPLLCCSRWANAFIYLCSREIRRCLSLALIFPNNKSSGCFFRSFVLSLVGGCCCWSGECGPNNNIHTTTLRYYDVRFIHFHWYTCALDGHAKVTYVLIWNENSVCGQITRMCTLTAPRESYVHKWRPEKYSAAPLFSDFCHFSILSAWESGSTA